MTLGVKLTRDGNTPYALAARHRNRAAPGSDRQPAGRSRAAPSSSSATAPRNSACPFDSQVGMTLVRVVQPDPGVFNEPIYNMVPPKGTDIVARLGFIAVGWPAFVNVRVDPVDYGIIATVEGVPSASGLLGSDHDDLGRAAPTRSTTTTGSRRRRRSTAKRPPDGARSHPRQAPSSPTRPTASLTRPVRVTARSYQLPDQPSTQNRRRSRRSPAAANSASPPPSPRR